MKSFKIRYKEGPHSEILSTIYKGHDAEHAEERFLDSMEEEGGTEGLEIVSTCQISIQDGIEKVKKS